MLWVGTLPTVTPDRVLWQALQAELEQVREQLRAETERRIQFEAEVRDVRAENATMSATISDLRPVLEKVALHTSTARDAHCGLEHNMILSCPPPCPMQCASVGCQEYRCVSH